jgi:hypothetical protein
MFTTPAAALVDDSPAVNAALTNAVDFRNLRREIMRFISVIFSLWGDKFGGRNFVVATDLSKRLRNRLLKIEIEVKCSDYRISLNDSISAELDLLEGPGHVERL